MQFVDQDKPVAKHGNKLPHWQQRDALIFVTWRLADSLPKTKLDLWHAERDVWLAHHPEPWDERTEDEYHTRFSQRLDDWLDQGEGSCVLRDPVLARIVSDAILHFDDERHRVDAFVIMPNHVHVLFQPSPQHTMAAILHSWKRHAAREINRTLGRVGALWQENYWDRLVRHGAHLAMCRDYIRRNPEKAKLREGEFILWDRGGFYGGGFCKAAQN